jgi:hypothetical protein
MTRCRNLSPIVIVAALAVLLAGLTSSVAAQSLGDESWRSEDDFVPLWRVRGEYLCWWTNGNPLPPLVTTSPPGTPLNQAGVLGTPGVETLFGDSTIDTGSRSGGRVTISRWLEDDDNSGIEFEGDKGVRNLFLAYFWCARAATFIRRQHQRCWRLRHAPGFF